jgi:hypothetical protein
MARPVCLAGLFLQNAAQHRFRIAPAIEHPRRPPTTGAGHFLEMQIGD